MGTAFILFSDSVLGIMKISRLKLDFEVPLQWTSNNSLPNWVKGTLPITAMAGCWLVTTEEVPGPLMGSNTFIEGSSRRHSHVCEAWTWLLML